MKVFFRVVVCVLIYSTRFSTLAQESSTLTPSESTSTNGEALQCTSLIPLKNRNITTEKTSANVTWYISQDDPGCIPETLTVNCVALQEDNQQGWAWVIQNSSTVNNLIEEATDKISVTIENLSEFTNYTCNGTMTMSDEQAETSDVFEFTTDQEVASEPLNLRIVGKTRPKIISIKWEKPAKNPGVFEYYDIHTVSFDPDYYIPKTCKKYKLDVRNQVQQESYTYTRYHAGYTYEFSVLLKNSAGNGASATINETTPSAASEPPTGFLMSNQMLDEEANTIAIDISWKTPCEPNGPIDQFEIDIEGYYKLDNLNIIRDLIFVNSTNTDEEYKTQIVVSPASVYTIGIRANGENVTGAFFKDTFETEDNVPGIPLLNAITDKGSTYFVVSWSEPERRAGNITNYSVEINDMMPLYDRDIDRCPAPSKFQPEVLPGNSGIYNFTKAHPYYKYNVSITATTSKGDGKPAVIFVETDASVPDMPDNLTFVLMASNTSGIISWSAPCNINGPIVGFSVSMNGTYSDDSSISDVIAPLTVQFENGTYDYSHSMELKEAYTYDAYIRVVLEDGTDGEANVISVKTPDGYPGRPILDNPTDADNASFTVQWEPPKEKTGKIHYYVINIVSWGPLYETNPNCSVNFTSFSYTEIGNNTMFRFTKGEPYYNYTVTITANTSKGFGNPSEEIIVETEQSIPESVQVLPLFISNTTEESEDYNAYANISFMEPCRKNGPLKNYELSYVGLRPYYDDHKDIISHKKAESFVFELKAEFNYTFSIMTVNERFSSTSISYNFKAPAGVPKFSTSTPIDLMNISKGTTSAKVMLKHEYFDEVNGDINNIAVIVFEKNVTGGSYGSWDGKNWAMPTEEDGAVYYQLLDKWWHSPEDPNNITITIGNENNCTESQNYCDKPLENDKDYYVIVKIFTSKFYKNSHTIHFRTDDVSKLGTILGIIFGLLALALLALAGFFVWKRKIMRLPPLFSSPRKSSTKSTSNTNVTIPIYKFVQYCKNLENNPEKLAEQYALLAEKTKEAVRMQTTVYAELTENRRKNRYTNILPYDETRVKLLIDEDDEIGSDYINASYIRGYSGKIEYIATQGPLPTTCRDFWKMVIQENVSIIVMVTQFIEQNKEKCYKYFPNNHENMIIGEDMEIKCSMELHFGTYCVRTLQVKKDTTQVTVTHMQYLDWPDFNVPKGTENMLQFCYQLRERLKIEGGYVIIHCSAGVGRTGTLIATDILLQNVMAGKNIDVFNTVLELRKQRTHMVQTQKQYMYIHNLVKDNFDQSSTTGINENSEPLYENLSVVKMKSDDDNLIAKEEETESQF